MLKQRNPKFSLGKTDPTRRCDCQAAALLVQISAGFSFAFASGGLELFVGESFNIANVLFDVSESTVFPNPNNGDFYIEFHSETDYQIKLYSNLGQIVLSRNIPKENTRIELNNISHGIYILHLKNKRNHFINKVIVN